MPNLLSKEKCTDPVKEGRRDDGGAVRGSGAAAASAEDVDAGPAGPAGRRLAEPRPTGPLDPSCDLGRLELLVLRFPEDPAWAIRATRTRRSAWRRLPVDHRRTRSRGFLLRFRGRRRPRAGRLRCSWRGCRRHRCRRRWRCRPRCGPQLRSGLRPGKARGPGLGLGSRSRLRLRRGFPGTRTLLPLTGQHDEECDHERPQRDRPDHPPDAVTARDDRDARRDRPEEGDHPEDADEQPDEGRGGRRQQVPGDPEAERRMAEEDDHPGPDRIGIVPAHPLPPSRLLRAPRRG